MDSRYFDTVSMPPRERPEERLFGEVRNITEIAAGLQESIAGGDIEDVRSTLSTNAILESLVITKGPGAERLRLVQHGYEALRRDAVKGHETAFDALSRQQQFEVLMREGGMPPMLVAEMLTTLYHGGSHEMVIGMGHELAGIDTAVLPAVAKAHILNTVGSSFRKLGMIGDARAENKRALDVLAANPSGDIENEEWVRLKLQHGLIVHRAAQHGAKMDMAQQLQKVLHERMALGDVMHEGRTILDIAEIIAEVAQRDHSTHLHEKAAWMAGVAAQRQMERGYINGAVKAEMLLARIEGRVIHNQAAQVFIIGKAREQAESIQPIMNEEIEMMKTMLEYEMTLPSACLIELGSSGQYVVQNLSEDPEHPVYSCVTVDRMFKKPRGPKENRRGGDGEVRQSISSILNVLLYATAGRDIADTHPIRVNKRDMFVKGKEKAGEHTPMKYRYKVEIPDSEGLQALLGGASVGADMFKRDHGGALDKITISGYSIMSFEDLVKLRASFDAQSQMLIAAEIERKTA